MRKELLISAKFDTSDFDKSVESMQKKLRELYAPSDAIRMQQTSQRLAQSGYGSIQGAPGPGGSDKSFGDYKRRMDSMVREEKSALEDKIRNTVKYQAIVDSIANSKKDDFKTTVQLAAAQRDLNRAKNEEAEAAERTSAALKEQLTLRNGFEKMRDSMSAMSPQNMAGRARASFNENPWKFMGSAVGGIAGAAAGGIGIYRERAAYPREAAANMAAANEAMRGRDIEQMYSGQSPFESMFAGERAQAMRGAKGEETKIRRTDTAGGLAKILGGMAAGGLIGSAGAGIGAIPGAIAGGFGGYMSMNEREKKKIFGSEQDYQSVIDKDLKTKEREFYENLKKQNIDKDKFFGAYSGRFQQDLGTQRQLGLSDTGLYGAGGFFDKQGFTQQQLQGSATGILGAGGSTRMARDSDLSLRASRNADLTNADKILGTISGSMGGSQSSKNSLIEIMSEGTRLGLDKSDFREENRKFSEAAAEFIYKSSSSSQTDAQSVVGLLGSFLSDKTSKGIDTAKSAYEKFQNITTETSGARGAFNYASISSDKDLQNIDVNDKRLLARLGPEDLVEGSATARYFQSKYGVSIEDLRKKAITRGFAAVSMTTSPEKMAAKLRDSMTKAGRDPSSITDYGDVGDARTPDAGNSLDAITASIRQGNANLSEKEAESMAMSMLRGQPVSSGALNKQSASILGQQNGPGARQADVMFEQAGESAKKFLDDFSRFSSVMDDARAGWQRYLKTVGGSTDTGLSESAAAGPGRPGPNAPTMSVSDIAAWNAAQDKSKRQDKAGKK